MTNLRKGFLCLVAATFYCAPAAHAATAEGTLGKCSKQVSSQTLKYAQSYIKAVRGCMDQVTKLVISNGQPVDGAAKKCMKAFRKVVNTEAPAKTLAAKLAAKVGKSCDPDAPKTKALHQEEDILGTGALGVQIDAQNLDAWCSNFAGNGSIDDFDLWVDCVIESATDGAQKALASMYPRLLEWLDELRPAIDALDADDPDQEVVDALAALDALNDALEGTTDDDRPELICSVICPDPLADCDDDAVNGCETDTATDSANCGGCGSACTSPDTCAGGGNAGVCGCTPTSCVAEGVFCGNLSDGCGGTLDCGTCAFSYTPSNFPQSSLDFASAPSSTLNCGATIIDSTAPTPTLTNWCGAPPVMVVETQAGGPDVVILALQSLTVSAGATLQMVGDRPVILAIDGNTTIDGTVTAAANGATSGVGGNVSCGAGTGINGGHDATSNDGSAGGGGGGFGTAGGAGGAGDSGAGATAASSTVGDATLIPLRGGCAGGTGGVTAGGGQGGGGGGAIQISSTGTLTVGAAAVIVASGGGGSAGSTAEDGGGGGGSGGGILLEADVLDVQNGAWVTANGGGGAEGNDTNSAAGASGSDGLAVSASQAAGGSGGEPDGGDGGAGASSLGSAIGGADGTGGFLSDGAGGGGGGGGTGRIRVNGATSCSLLGTFSGSQSTNCASCPNCPPEGSCTSVINGGSQYWLCLTARNWTDARGVCLNVGYDLVSVQDAPENSFLAGHIGGSSHWIGYNDQAIEGTFVWADGAPVTFTGFSGPEPSGDGDCTELLVGGGWNDLACGDARPYICEGTTHCGSGTLDGDETDVDCGGATCAGCADGDSCSAGTDCASGSCETGTCVSCSDGIQNSDETDVDCGGATCAGCADGDSCSAGTDCASGSCETGTCVSCSDGIQNGDETDVDCGGATCAGCSNGDSCNAGTDCASGVCDTGTCAGAFPYQPSNFDQGLLNFATAPSSVLNCGTTIIDSTGLTLTNWCGTAPVMVAQAQPQAGGPNVVVVVMQDLTVAAGSILQVVGNKPVILAIDGNTTIDGTVTAAAIQATSGAGGNVSCGAGTGNDGVHDATSNDGSAGGAGGGFGTAGGTGGAGDAGAGATAASSAIGNASLTPLQGGCAGGAGGVAAGGGQGGGGGGAIQISGSGALSVGASGVIVASGGGGSAGSTSEDGGGGGGSGGAILLEADVLAVAGAVTANGGGGAEGNDTNSALGVSGTDGLAGSTSQAAGGSGGEPRGGDGGAGASALGGAVGGANGTGGAFNNGAGGGGGGGGIGRIRVNASTSCSLTGTFSGPASTNCP